MARKSGWQEFSENFNSVYGTFKQIGQDVETGRIMDDEKFMAEGKAGAGLKGSALEKARYKALGDIYTKYGNAKDGLAVRTQLAGLESADRKNELDAATLQEQIKQNGLLKSAIMSSQANVNNAGAANNYSLVNDRNATQPYRLRGLEIGNATDEFSLDTSKQMLPYQLGTASADLQTAQANALVAAGTVKPRINQAEANVDATTASTGLTNATTTGKDLDNDVLTAAAGLKKIESGFLTTVSDPAYWKAQGIEGDPTPDQRQEALINMYKGSDIPIERQMAVESALGRHGIDKLQTVALETAQSAQNEMQKGGLPGLIKWYDGVDDGDATALDIRPVDGGFELFSSSGTGDNRNENVLFSGASEAEIEAQLMGQIKNPGSGMEIAASILDMRAKAADISKTEALTKESGARALFTEENTTGLAGGRKLTEAQLKLANAKAKEISARIRAEYSAEGKDERTIIADQAAVDKYLISMLPFLAYDDSLDADALVEQFRASRKSISFDPVPE